MMGVPNANAWDSHFLLMHWVLPGLSSSTALKLDEKTTNSCPPQDEEVYERYRRALLLNPLSRLPSPSPACPAPTVSGREILGSTTVLDEPDRGMDQELDSKPGNPYDPLDERKFLGGYHGTTSQGFRHMYFGGWKLAHPIATFQVPTHALGQAPMRIQLLASQARELIRGSAATPQDRVWGYRILGWAIHYAQDLAQPFHATQIPNLRMVPWNVLFNAIFTDPLHPAQAFNALVKETTRTISNYHWAYETYTLLQVKAGDQSPYAKCLSNPELYSNLQFDSTHSGPEELGHAVANASIKIASRMGHAEYDFFGSDLKEPNHNLPLNIGMPNYVEYATRADLKEPRERLNAVTCTALSNAVLASRDLIEWALQP